MIQFFLKYSYLKTINHTIPIMFDPSQLKKSESCGLNHI